MRIGIIHLTDLHIEYNSNLDEMFEELKEKIINNFQNKVKALFVVLSGDIAWSGKKEEYEKTSEYIDKLIERIKNDIKLGAKIIMVPGNHDCNFEYDNQARKQLITNVNYDSIGDDDSIINLSLKVQKDFWEFFKKYNDIPHNKLYYNIVENIDGINICFRCYNTAWMSKLEEKPGTLFFPVKLIENKTSSYDDCVLNIAVYHHPINWFNPSTEENNKNEFQNHIEKSSSIQIVGHEHVDKYREEKNHEISVSSNIFYGAAFNNSKGKSGFQLLQIDLNQKKGYIKRYEYNTTQHEFKNIFEKEFSLTGRENRKFQIRKEFLDRIEDINIPLKIDEKDITLSEIYVFPDIEPIKSGYDSVENYIDGSSILNSEMNCLIEGDSQSGKTSLLYQYFKSLYDKKYYPIFLNGSFVNNRDINKFLSKAFNEIYTTEYKQYVELSKSKKILLIDDFQNVKIKNKEALNEIIEKFTVEFSKIIVTINTEFPILPSTSNLFKDFKQYKIKPFGHKKKNDLIEKYLQLKSDDFIDEQNNFENVKTIFDKIKQLMGNKLIPSYPIYVLSVLQALLNYKGGDLQLTAFGYCYQTLIHLALAKYARIKNEHIESYLNFLKEFSFYLFKNEKKEISKEELTDFISDYKKEFVISNDISRIIENLLRSNIFKNCDNYFGFKYKYVYYFFVAQYLAEKKDEKEGKSIIENLIKNLYLPRNANILVLIAHHVRDKSFIEEVTLNTMLLLEEMEPITLEKNDSFYQQIRDIAEEITVDIIEDKDPKAEREKRLKIEDKIDNLNNKSDLTEEHYFEDNLAEDVREFFKAFKALEILGQIVKNRYGSLKIDDQKDMIEILYETAFRLVRFLANWFESSKNEFKEMVIKEEKLEKEDDKKEIEKKVNKFFQFIELGICLNIFTKLIYSVGVKELKYIFDKVANSINTPAAKLVSFSINSYYNPISVRELKELAKEFEKNPVAFQILRARVISYLYENYVDFKKKQQIASLLKLNMKSTHLLGTKNYD